MKLEIIGKSVTIPTENGKQLRDSAKAALDGESLKKYDGMPCYLFQIGKGHVNDAKKRFLQEIAQGRFYWEIFDSSKLRTEVVADTMMQFYKASDNRSYGLALFTTVKEILRRMDVRR